MSLRKENKRKKAAGSRGAAGARGATGFGWRRFFRSLGLCAALVGLGWSAGAGWQFLCSTPYFGLSTIVVTGNKRLGEEDIRRHLGLGRENLLVLNLRALETRLLESPWIRSLRMRKQLPDTLLVEIEEKVPLALREEGDRFALLDQDGREIELLPRGQIPFLPVVRGGAAEQTLAPETLALLRALKETRVAEGRETVEIEDNPRYGLLLTIDGLSTRMGEGDYRKKLERWTSVEAGIRDAGIRVDYVDVRFNDRVVVRKIKEDGNNG